MSEQYYCIAYMSSVVDGIKQFEIESGQSGNIIFRNETSTLAQLQQKVAEVGKENIRLLRVVDFNFEVTDINIEKE